MGATDMTEYLRIVASDEQSSELCAGERPAGDLHAGYEVGYGKPPRTHQFKKGVSGNPKGRKKNKPITDIRDLADGVLNDSVQVRDGAKVRSVSSLEAALRAYLREALLGRPTAARNFFKLGVKAGMMSAVRPQSFVKLMETGGDDGKVIRMYRAEQEELSRKHGKDHGDGHEHAIAVEGRATSRRAGE
jgi:hypothetical protein